MIAKIQDIDYNSGGLYDNLEKVRYSTFSHHIIAVPTEEDIMILSSDKDERESQIMGEAVAHNDTHMISNYGVHPDVTIIDKNNIEKTGNHLNFIVPRDKDNNEKLIVFNTMGFILNDQGKTIERIPSISDMKPR